MNERYPGSFRDPSGFVFQRDGSLFRQINRSFRQNFDHFLQSGLYDELTKAGLLIPHNEVDIRPPLPDLAYKIVRPAPIDFVSYPYEWCFSQLKHAATATLELQRKALEFGMSLRDANAYNIQFHQGRPVLIDTLSFEIYREGEPWVAYRQFCQHFLAILAVMYYRDVRLNQLLKGYPDGLPLDLATSLLPARTWVSLPLLTHLHAHARFQKKYGRHTLGSARGRVSKRAVYGLIDSLESGVRGMKLPNAQTEWVDYYREISYSPETFELKKQVVADFLDFIKPQRVVDLGANTGVFSRLVAENGAFTISCDFDHAVTEANYRTCLAIGEARVLPLLVDAANPSPGIGWMNEERMPLLQRLQVDSVLALALIHHLAFTNNLPFNSLTELFSRIAKWLIIEFVPKHDPQAQSLIQGREHVFTAYTQEAFETEFRTRFHIRNAVPLGASGRTLFLMERKNITKQ